MRHIPRLVWIISLTIFLVSCCTLNIENYRWTPSYKGVDPKLKPYVDEYYALAKLNGTKADKDISMGFPAADYLAETTIGQCYTGNFKEIDIDPTFWGNSTRITKQMLLFHELSHCACGRDHDYADGKKYADVKDIEFSKEGRFPDDCPASIMYPIILSDSCAIAHYSAYIKEMFNHCSPY